jgi:hypothetical protein
MARSLRVAGALLGLGVVAGVVFAVRESLVAAGDPGAAALRLGAVGVGAVAALAAAGRRWASRASAPRAPWRDRLAGVAERGPAGFLLACGAAVALPLTLRLAIDDVVHLPIAYAVLGFVAVLALGTSAAGRRASLRSRTVALGAAGALFLGGRLLAGLLGPEWMRGAAGNGLAWRLATGLVAGVLLFDAARGRLRGSGARLSAALALLVVLHAALARESDAAGAAFALLALGARAASEVAGPSSRGGVVLWSVGLLALHVAAFHALGHDHTLGATDLGGALVPRTGASGAAVDAAAVPWGSVLALAARFACAWAVLLLAARRSLARSPVPGAAAQAVQGLAVAVAGGGVAIAVVLPAWWTWAWWGVHAWAVYALLLVDLTLLLPFTALLSSRASPAAPPAAAARAPDAVRCSAHG